MKIVSLVFAACLGLTSAQAAEPQLVAPHSRPSVSASEPSSAPVLSADGRVMAYVSGAPNLVSNQGSAGFNLFAKDLSLGNSVLANRTTNALGFGATTLLIGISSNGQFIAYQSDAAEVSTPTSATNATPQIYVRDMLANTTQLATETLAGNPTASQTRNPVLSSDGRYIVFESQANDLVPLNPGQSTTNVYRRDFLLHTNILISRSRSGDRWLANNHSFLPGISADGQRVVFISKATDLTFLSGWANPLGDVFVFWNPHQADPIWCGSLSNYFINAANPSGSYACTTAAISADGKFVAMSAASAVDGQTMLFRRDLDAYLTTLIASNVSSSVAPQISADGAFITFEDGTNVLRWSAADSLIQVVSVTTNSIPLALNLARESRATPDGNTIVFLSNSPELTSEGSTNLQVYSRNMPTGVTRLVSVSTNGAAGKGVTAFTTVSVSDDGSRVAFDAEANDLVPMDNNDANDVFVRDLSAQQTTLVSTALPGTLRVSAAGHAYVGANAFSADARFLTFTRHDTDAVTGDTNQHPDVFITDLLSGTTIPVGISNGINSDG